jgi:NADH-quinone oxidoreductase subunit H
MSIGWKVLIPVSLVWIVLVGAVRVLRNAEGFTATEVLLWVGIPLAILLIAAVAWPGKKPVDDDLEDEYDDALLAIDPDTVDQAVVAESRGRYPVPPLDLQVPITPIRAARQRAEQQAALQGVGVLTGSAELPGGSDVIS